MGSVVFFQGGDQSGASYPDLWVSDGTAAGTYAVGGAQNAGVAGAHEGLHPIDITPFVGGVLFNGGYVWSPSGEGLWFSDGTAAGTYQIGGANDAGVAGVDLGYLDPTNIRVFGNKALFLGRDSDNFDGLWVTDGTASGTFELGGLENDGVSGKYFQSLYTADLTPAGNNVFFIGHDIDAYVGLWVTDGTTKGTIEIGGLNNAAIRSGPDGADFSPGSNNLVASLGNDVLLTGVHSLWVSDGTVNGTVDIAPAIYGIYDLTVFGTSALFRAGASGAEDGLWITDGTAAGTTEIGGSKNAGIVDAGLAGLDPADLTVFGGKAVFLGIDSSGYQGLWVTDGTAAGTTEIGGLKNAGLSGAWRYGLNPTGFVSIGSKVLFTADDPSGVKALWVTDGTSAGTFEIGGTNNAGVTGAPARGLDPSSITGSGGTGYFTITDSTGDHLWVSDGTVAGTHVVAAGSTGSASDPLDLTAAALGGALQPPPITGDLLLQNANGQAAVWEMDQNTRAGGGAVSLNPGPAWRAVGTGAFFTGDTADILWQNTSTGQAAVWEMDGNTRLGGGTVSLNPGPTWKAIGTGDFNGDHLSDILWQNTSTGQAAVWNMDGTTRLGGGVVSLNPGTSLESGRDGGFLP